MCVIVQSHNAGVACAVLRRRRWYDKQHVTLTSAYAMLPRDRTFDGNGSQIFIVKHIRPYPLIVVIELAPAEVPSIRANIRP